MKIEVFKCEKTGKLFESEEEFSKHVEKLNDKQKKSDLVNHIKVKSEEIKNTPRLTATSIEDFRLKMLDAVYVLNGDNPDKLIGLFFEDLMFTNVSNTHSKPINGVSNWSKDSTNPTSYLGWIGNVYIVYSQTKNTGANRDKIEDIVNHFPGFNSGSGGYYGRSFNGVDGCVLQLKLRLYLQDFPLIEKQYKNFIEIKKKYQEYQNYIDVAISDKIAINTTLIEYLEIISAINIKIRNLDIKRTNIYSEIDKIKDEIKNKIKSENVFDLQEDFESYKKIFK